MLLIILHLVNKLINSCFLFPKILYVPLTFRVLLTNFLTRFEFFIFKHVKRNCVNCLFWQIFENLTRLHLFCNIANITTGFHFIPQIVRILSIYKKNIAFLICNNPRMSLSAPSLINCWITNNISRIVNSLQNWSSYVIRMRKKIELAVKNYSTFVII